MVDQTVTIAGWVHEKRKMGGLLFLIIRDKGGIIQVTLPKKWVPEDVFETARSLSKESVVAVTGKVQKADQAPGGLEVFPEEIDILNMAATPLPMDPTGKVGANLDTRLDNRVMDLRRQESGAIFRIRDQAFRSGKEYLRGKDFMEIHTPRIISTSSEGGTELFPIAYFEREAFLAQSPQLYKQMMMGTGFDRVFEAATYFRAEEHDTIWHLNEVTAFDCELAFIKDENDVMDVIEGLVLAMIDGVREKCAPLLEAMGKEVPQITEVPRLTYTDCIKMLDEAGMKVSWGDDLNSESEKKIGELMNEKGHVLYFITKFPTEAKPFYTMPDSEEPDISNSFDMEFKGREIVSGSQRIHTYDLLTSQIKAKGLDPNNFGPYLDAFKFGMPPHGGFGLGIERFLMILLGLPNIREAVLFPRDRKRLTP